MRNLIKMWKRSALPATNAFILMYHRISSPLTDPWDIAVSEDSFIRQLEQIRDHFDAVPLDSLGSSRSPSKPQVALSFDDGYADNFDAAMPLLAQLGIPATFFITSSMPGTDRTYWWDELADIFLVRSTLPDTGMINVGLLKIPIKLGRFSSITEDQSKELRVWKANSPAINARVSAFISLWRALKYATPAEIAESMRQIREWAGHFEKNPSSMSWEKIIALSEHPLFTIGAHTVDHPMLPVLHPETQEMEIYTCREEIMAKTGKKVDCFAAPFGGYNKDTVIILRKLGFRLAFTTEPGKVNAKLLGKKPFELPRIQVTNTTDIRELINSMIV